MPYSRSKSTNQESMDWYRKWQNKQSADFDIKIDVRSAEKDSLSSRKGSTTSLRSRKQSTRRKGSVASRRSSSDSSSSSSSDADYKKGAQTKPVKRSQIAPSRAMSKLIPSEDIEERSDESDNSSGGKRGSGAKKSSDSPRSEGSIKSLGSLSSDASLQEDELDRIIMKKYA